MTDRQNPTTAAVYARVSSDRQDVDLSIAAQLRALRNHALCPQQLQDRLS